MFSLIQNIKSEQIYEKSLFLRGIYKKDYKKIEEIFHERLCNEIQQKNIKMYDKIPQYFTNINKWIKQTNISCWYCYNQIKSIPKFIPKTIETKNFNSEEEKIYNISVEGLFCSFNCAQAYIDECYSKDIYDHINKTNMLLFLYYLFNNKIISYIKPALSKFKMTQFGGNLTQQEYENEILQMDSNQQKEIEDINFSILCESYIKNIN
jgi:hypothetical protein